MPAIQAFRGIRYDLGHVGSLSNVVAPPYDVIDAELQSALYDRHPANVVRLILNKDEPGDDEHDNRYTRAVRQLRSWLRDGVVFTEGRPAEIVGRVQGESQPDFRLVSRCREPSPEHFGGGDRGRGAAGGGRPLG